MTIYGNPSDANLLQLKSFPSTIQLMPIGPMVATCKVTSFAIATKYMDAARNSVLVIYELDENDIGNSTLVAQSTPWNGGTGDPHRFTSTDLLNDTVLEGGKRYLIGLHGNVGAGTSATTAYDADQGTSTGTFYKWDGVAYTGTAPATLGSPPTETLTRHMSVFVDTAPLGLQIDDVNGTDTIVSGGPVVINGQMMAGVDTVTVGGYPLTVTSATDNIVECEPFDVLTSSVPLGGVVSLVVDDGTATASKGVLIAAPAGIQYVTVAGVQPYLAQGLSVANGDQMATETTAGGSQLTLTPDTDVLYSPAVPDGTTHTRYWYDGSTWESGQVVVKRTTPLVWTGTPTPPPAVVGESYSYHIGLLLDGGRPVTLSDAGAPLPPGLSYDSATYPERIIGVPTTAGFFADIITAADNGGTELSNVFAMEVGGVPEIYALTIINITEVGAGFTIATTLAAGSVYYVADTAEQRPSVAQIVAGLNADGTPATAAGSYTVTAEGLQPEMTFVGFAKLTQVTLWVVQSLNSLNYSNVLVQGLNTEGQRDTLVSFYNRPGGPGNKFGG